LLLLWRLTTRWLRAFLGAVLLLLLLLGLLNMHHLYCMPLTWWP
jgi:hypothetical protein